MNLLTRLVLVSAIGIIFGQTSSWAKPLDVGDDAPQISVNAWMKGAPVLEFQKGKVYVVEFWATWCGPCRMSVPHLTTLQRKFEGDLVVIGVASNERGLTPLDKNNSVENFMTKMGDRMDYRVALDFDGVMNRTWLDAAGQNGIPTAFLVDGEGKISFIGHPTGQLDAAIVSAIKILPYDAPKADGPTVAGDRKPSTKARTLCRRVLNRLWEKLGKVKSFFS